MEIIKKKKVNLCNFFVNKDIRDTIKNPYSKIIKTHLLLKYDWWLIVYIVFNKKFYYMQMYFTVQNKIYKTTRAKFIKITKIQSIHTYYGNYFIYIDH